MNDHHIIGDVFGYVGDLILGMCRRVSLVYAGDYNGTVVHACDYMDPHGCTKILADRVLSIKCLNAHRG